MSKDITYYDIRPPYCYHVFDDEISDAAKITMLAIMRHINLKEAVSIRSLANELHEDIFTIKSHLDELEENGLDLRESRSDGGPKILIKRL